MTSYDSLNKTEETNKREDAQIEHAFGTKDPKREAREKEAEAFRKKMDAKLTPKKTNNLDRGR